VREAQVQDPSATDPTDFTQESAAAVTASASSPTHWHASAWSVFGTLAAAAAIVIVTYVSWWRPRHFQTTVATEVGHYQTVSLPDGSAVELNTNTHVAITFSVADRRVNLGKGEAHFTVAKNPARPFIVEANGVAVRAVGTAFDVRLRPDAVEVLVTEGKVRVDDAAKGGSLLPVTFNPGLSGDVAAASAAGETERVLSAGQRVVITAPSAAASAVVATVAPEEMQRELAWQNRRLEFVSASLADIVADFNRYNRQQLVIADPQLAQKRFGGSFQANDPERFVRMLQENFPVTVEQRPGETILRLAP
jgi:transmembrane sensor